jgi:predicted metal-dependent peptidase
MTKKAYDEKKLAIRLAKAKTNLILEYPFIGTIALNMPFTLTEDVPTAATNGKRVLFNPDFISNLTDEELKFLVAHECMHPMLEHNYRRHERNHKKWNQAGDYVINKLLIDEKLGKMPSMGLYSEDIYKAGNGSSDGIYKILPEPEEDGEGEGTELDNCEDAPGDAAQKA